MGTQRLKFVGGAADGKEFDVPDSYRDMRVPTPRKVGLHVGPVPEHEPLTVFYDVYTRRCLSGIEPNGERDTFQFMALAEMSDMQALRHQFAK
jgi:hypothetical protein